MSVVVFYIQTKKVDIGHNNVEIKESFLEFINIIDIIATKMTEQNFNSPIDNGLYLENLSGPGYDKRTTT